MADALDVQIVQLFSGEPKISALEASRRLGVARVTLASRLDKLAQAGAIKTWAPSLNPARFGYPVLAFCFLTINQALGHERAVDALENIPEVIEVHTVSGESDILAKVAARSNADLQRVLDTIAATDTVLRSSTMLALNTHFESRTLPLFECSTEQG